MNPLLVVVLCAAVIVTIVIATKKSKKNAKANISSQQASANQSRVNKSNLIRCKADGIWDKDGTSGYYENGNIYCCSKIRDYQIGTYVQETNGSLTVKNTRGYVIGKWLLRKFCVSDFRQNQEFHVINVHNGGLFSLTTTLPMECNGMRAGTA